MHAGGVTETIWYFAGYLHLAPTEVKARLEYEDGALTPAPRDYVVKLPDFVAPDDLTELFSRKTKPLETTVPDLPASSSFDNMHFRLEPPKAPIKVPDPDNLVKHAGSGASGTGGSAGSKPAITATYENGGDEMLAEINQVNVLDDNDLYGVMPGSDVTKLNDIDVPAVLDDLVVAADEQVPIDLRLPEGGALAVSDFVEAYDANVASGGGNIEHSVTPGIYVNGELRDSVPSAEPATPSEDVKTTETKPGQWAELGSNISVNAALIVDLNEAAPSMIVMGDYFKTNSIIQTNSFIDNDRVSLGPNEPEAIAIGDNKADNIANFIEEGGLHGTVSAKFAGLTWRIDIVEDDFYDINLLKQRNYLQDNDVMVQETAHSHHQLEMGSNGQYNLTELYDFGLQYDLIIVAGNYHGWNYILQHNIVLDDDVVMIGTGDEATLSSPQISAGQNALLNDATIANYGGNSFVPLADGMIDLVAGLASNNGTLDPSFASLIAGNGSGELAVLYVKGDYYDINAIWQVNIIADADTAIQLLSGRGTEEEAVTQSVSTGGNEATNSAAILDIGSTYSHLGGQSYQYSMLVQANLVVDDVDEVIYRDTDALVPELIAFTGASEENQDDEFTLYSRTNPADDVLGSVLN